jgi:hypothetical protein
MYLLYISKNTIEIFKKYQKVGELTWTPETLSKTLSQIKSNFSSKFRIILSDHFITVSSLLLPPTDSKKKSQIQSKIQPTIAEDLSQTIWDYKIVAKYNNLNLVQIIFVSSKFFNIFRTAVQSSQIKVTLLESFSTVVCRFLPAKKLVFLCYQDLLLLSFNQTPIFSSVLTKKLSQEDIDNIFAYAKNRFQILPQQVLFSPTGDIAFNQFEFGNLRPEYTNLNPLKGIVHSSDIHGSDAQTTRLEIPKNNLKTPLLPKIMFIIPLILLLVIFAFIFINQKIDTNSNSQINTITPTLTPIPTKAVSDFKIQILNGTGVSGQAGEVSDLLTKNEFKVESVDNASNYDFTQTQIETKSLVPDSITNLVKESLKDNYPAKILDTNLPESSKFDIIITTGK